MYICVDFDGTICDHDFPDIGEPVPGAIVWMKRWHELGAKLILWTMRSNGPNSEGGLAKAEYYLHLNDIKLFGVNSNPDQASWSASPKAYANIYVDDAAFGCPLIRVNDFNRACVDWAIVGPAIERKLLR